jgi:hypothetical protein
LLTQGVVDGVKAQLVIGNWASPGFVDSQCAVQE